MHQPLCPPHPAPLCSSLEVFSLLVALFAQAVGPFRNWKQTVVALLATVTAVLIPLTNE